mgnify:CR=1 FL=1
MGPVEMLLGGLPNHQTTPINTTNMSKKRHTKEAQIKAIREHESGRSQAEICKELMRKYLLEEVVPRTQDTDNALKKFYKAVLIKMQEAHSAEFAASNLVDIVDKLDN